MKDVLENLLDIEKKAKEVVETSKKDAEALISKKKQEADSLMDAAKKKLDAEEKKQLESIQKKVSEEVKNIEEQGKVQLSGVKGFTPAKREEAKHISSEVIFGA